MTTTATIERDSDYAPCCYLIVREGHTTRDEDHTLLIQSCLDYPGLARNFGYAGDSPSAARAWLDACLGVPFDASEYFDA